MPPVTAAQVDLWTPMSREEFVKSVSKLKLGEDRCCRCCKLDLICPVSVKSLVDLG